MTDSYRPGVCNIGPAEVQRRRDAGIAGLAAGAAVLAAAIGFGAPKAVRLLAAVPLAGGASGLLQARARFCSGFGMRGLTGFGATEAVEAADDRAADRARSIRITATAAALGAGAAGLSLLLP